MLLLSCGVSFAFIISVFLCAKKLEKYARFIRWDRDGAVVTRHFDYINQPQGYDASVSSATPELENIQQIQKSAKRLRDDNRDHREFRVLKVPDRDNPEVKKRIVVSFPPKHTARSPFGRATRPMLAFDIEMGEIIFLKDYWRADVDGMEKEGEIYALLESHRVPNIAPFGREIW